MKIPFWNATITLYQRRETANGAVDWVRSVHSGCFWQRKTLRSRNDGAEFANTASLCRIPEPWPVVNIGDIIVCGNVQDVIDEYVAGQRSADLLKKYAGSSMLVGDVHINDRRLPGVNHLYAGG